MQTTSGEHVLAGVVERLDPVSLAERMIATFREGIPGYRRLSDETVAGQIFEVSRQNVELFTRVVVEDRRPTEEELAPFRDSARNRAGEGMPLEDLLHAYRLGGRLAWEDIVAQAGPDEEGALAVGAARVMEYIDVVSSVIAQAYFDERQHLVSEEERRLRDLFESLVSGAPLRDSQRELAGALGLPVADSYRPFAVALPGAAPAREHAHLASALRRDGLLALTEGDRVAGLAAPTCPDGALEGTCPPAAWRVLAEPAPQAELRAALADVRLLVDLARRSDGTPGASARGALSTGAFLPERLLAASPRLAAALRRRALGAVEEYARRRGTDLLETLERFLACGLDRRRAAAALHVHPNTLDYRLRRLEELSGLSLARPDDLALLVLALKVPHRTD